jgi:hypothetical protein
MAPVLLDFLVHPDFPEGMVLRLLYYPVTLDFLLLQLVTVLGYLLYLLILDFRSVKVQLHLCYLGLQFHLGFPLVQVLEILFHLGLLRHLGFQLVHYLVLLDLPLHLVPLSVRSLDFLYYLEHLDYLYYRLEMPLGLLDYLGYPVLLLEMVLLGP